MKCIILPLDSLEAVKTSQAVFCHLPAPTDVQELQAVLELVHPRQAPVIEVETLAEIQVAQVLQMDWNIQCQNSWVQLIYTYSVHSRIDQDG